MSDILMIGIAGGTGSGKSTLTARIKEHFGEHVTVLNHDNYYKAHDDMTYDERSLLNYDHPDAFETGRMADDVRALLKGHSVDVPVYDYSIHNRSKDSTVHVTPKQIIVIEGILVLENKELRDLMDVKVFVDADADERLMRRIKRDTMERARTVESVLNQYSETVKPMHEEFVEPSKRYADIIIPRGGENKAGINMLITYMMHMLSGDL